MSQPPAAAPTPPGLDLAGLETVYDALAQAMDSAGPQHSERMLVKLALLQAQNSGNADQFARLLEVALRDLD